MTNAKAVDSNTVESLISEVESLKPAAKGTGLQEVLQIVQLLEGVLAAQGTTSTAETTEEATPSEQLTALVDQWIQAYENGDTDQEATLETEIQAMVTGFLNTLTGNKPTATAVSFVQEGAQGALAAAKQIIDPTLPGADLYGQADQANQALQELGAGPTPTVTGSMTSDTYTQIGSGLGALVAAALMLLIILGLKEATQELQLGMLYTNLQTVLGQAEASAVYNSDMDQANSLEQQSYASIAAAAATGACFVATFASDAYYNRQLAKTQVNIEDNQALQTRVNNPESGVRASEAEVKAASGVDERAEARKAVTSKDKKLLTAGDLKNPATGKYWNTEDVINPDNPFSPKVGDVLDSMTKEEAESALNNFKAKEKALDSEKTEISHSKQQKTMLFTQVFPQLVQSATQAYSLTQQAKYMQDQAIQDENKTLLGVLVQSVGTMASVMLKIADQALSMKDAGIQLYQKTSSDTAAAQMVRG